MHSRWSMLPLVSMASEPQPFAQALQLVHSSLRLRPNQRKVARTADGATVSAPGSLFRWLPTRPQCMICATMRPPSACTASVTAFQPATCASVWRPGVRQ